MTLDTQIRQQQATVGMLEKLLKARRCTQADVDQARRRLADLEAQQNFKPASTSVERPSTPVEPEPAGRRVGQDEYVSLQAELSKDADRLNRRMADLSNKLHEVPPGVSCPELVRMILDLKAQIETIWDKKRYLERNRMLPEEAAEPDTSLNARKEVAPEKFALAYEKRRLVDLRSKLKKKLENPKAKAGKRVEWETELAKANLQIAELDIKLGTL